MALARHNVRFQCSERYTPDHASYLFVFDHCQFTELCGMATNFVELSRDKVRKEWDKFYDARKAKWKEKKHQEKLKAKKEKK